jgi:tRNA pseudouridine13 synthase
LENYSPGDLLAKDYAFHRVYQPLKLSATLKSCAEDFIVEEDVSVDFSGDGEHCWIYLQKKACNTDWVAQQLAKFCQVKKMAVSYAGLKDRHALTSQWFSVQLPGKPTPDWSAFEEFFLQGRQSEDETVRVLQSFRHNRKLQRGALKGNHFRIILRDLSDNSEESSERIRQRCQQISQSGVPNYFGEQRFGRGHNNLEQAIKFFSAPHKRLAKHKRSIYLSASRSWIFNHILSARIEQHNWDKRLAGDVFMLDGRSACFKDSSIGSSGDTSGDVAGHEAGHEAGQVAGLAEDVAAKDIEAVATTEIAIKEIERRLANNEIHPTAAMWGDGEIMVTGAAAALEASIIDRLPVFRDGLVSARLQGQRRACRVIPANMECFIQDDTVAISFSLPAGSYATIVLAEIFSQLLQPV